MNSTVPKIVGALFLAAMAASIAGNGLMLPIITEADYLGAVQADGGRLRVGAVLMLLNSVFVAAIGVLMYQTLAQRDTLIAVGYLASRIIESVVLLFGIISLMSLLIMAEEYAKDDGTRNVLTALGKSAIDGNWHSYNIAMIVLGSGSLPFCYVLYQLKLVPRYLSVLGFIGYSILAATSLLAILDIDLGLVVTVPVFLFEVVLGFWLIVRGFEWTSFSSHTAIPNKR